MTASIATRLLWDFMGCHGDWQFRELRSACSATPTPTRTIDARARLAIWRP